MLRSLMTAVTGVRAHQTMLDVTGNNIANANTTGFKKDITVFQDLFYQTQKAATAPGDGRGGSNAAQVGLGVQVGAIETIFTQGGASYTGNPTDMMIQGNGFFVYSDGSGSNYYSRAGSNTRDMDNNVVQSGTGYYLQGYEMSKDPLNSGQYVKASNISTVSIPLGKKLEPNATSRIDFQCNLDSRSAAYLPYGFLDLPYTGDKNIGWPSNSAGTAKVTFPPTTSGTEYDVQFLTGYDDTKNEFGLANAPKDGTNYLNMTIQIGENSSIYKGKTITGNPMSGIAFDMVGIDDTTGKPILKLSDALAVDASKEPVQYQITLARADKTANATYDLVYEDGVLQFRNVGNGNSVDFSYNVLSSMNYSSFTIPSTVSGAGQAYKVLAEFDETNLDDRKTTLTLWVAHDETDATSGDTTTKIEKVLVDVFFDASGAFDHVGEFTDLAGNTGTALTLSTDLQSFLKDKFRVVVDGSTISFRAGVDINSMTPVGTITQGGYHQTKQTIYDCNGNPYTLEVNFKKITENRWRWEAFLLDENGKAVSTDATCETVPNPTPGASTLVPEPNTGEILFCGCGPIGTPLSEEITLPFSLIGEPNQKVTLNFGGNGDKLYGVTQYASDTTTKAVYQDGYGMGVLSDYSIGTDGTITGTYTNGQRIPLYRVALATFANEQGLEKMGETMFRETVNSGNANIDAAATSSKGSIMAQNVEMSNVDLTEEFTHLIIAQRGFQANTRVITTSDQILEEVVNLKR